jgi:hypothetical protein
MLLRPWVGVKLGMISKQSLCKVKIVADPCRLYSDRRGFAIPRYLGKLLKDLPQVRYPPRLVNRSTA